MSRDPKTNAVKLAELAASSRDLERKAAPPGLILVGHPPPSPRGGYVGGYARKPLRWPPFVPPAFVLPTTADVSISLSPGVADPLCPTETPPPSPAVPRFFHLLSPEGQARFVRRAIGGVNQPLRLHCSNMRVRAVEKAADFRRVMDESRFDFPRFIPRARPYDWRIDD